MWKCWVPLCSFLFTDSSLGLTPSIDSQHLWYWFLYLRICDVIQHYITLLINRVPFKSYTQSWLNLTQWLTACTQNSADAPHFACVLREFSAAWLRPRLCSMFIDCEWKASSSVWISLLVTTSTKTLTYQTSAMTSCHEWSRRTGSRPSPRCSLSDGGLRSA